jgi:hypothetical protein
MEIKMANAAKLANATRAYVKYTRLPIPANADGSVMSYEIAFNTNSGLEQTTSFDLAADATAAQINSAVENTVQQWVLDLEGTNLNANRIMNFDKAT